MSERRAVEELDGRTAGFISRMLAFLLDVLVLTIIVAIGSWLAVQTDDLLAEVIGDDAELAITATGLFAILTPFIIVFYFVVSWSLSGKTPGKSLLGLKVVRADGYPPTIGRSLVRIVGYFLSLIVFFLGFFWILVDRRRRGWHDHLAGTWVVYDWAKRRPGQIYEDMRARDASKVRR